MTKITFGDQHGRSRAEFKVVSDGKSNSEITVGEQFDDSVRKADVLDLGGLSAGEAAALARELLQLRTALEGGGAPAKSAAAQLAAAAAAARQGDAGGLRRHLAGAGKWALDAATKIGVPLATAALKAALGLSG